MSNLKVFSGRASLYFARQLEKYHSIKLGKNQFSTFADGELWTKYDENIRGTDVFIVQSTNPPAENLMELLIMMDAAKRSSAKRIIPVIPYFGYARQDRKDQPRVSITAKLIANMLEKAGADRIITMDLHAPQIQGFFDIPVDHLFASAVFLEHFAKLKIPNLAISCTDVGGLKTARAYAKRLNADLLIIDKRRNKPNEAEVMNIIGDPSGKNVLIVDDIIDTGGTFVNAVEAFKKGGATNIYGLCTHPVFSGNAVEKLTNSSLKQLIVSDTLPLKQTSPKIKVLSVAKVFAEAIYRSNRSQSISSLFKNIDR